MTGFRCGGIGGNYDKFLPLVPEFVLQTRPEQPESGRHYICAFYILRHSYQVGFPDANGIPGVGYPPAFLMYKVPALVRDVLV